MPELLSKERFALRLAAMQVVDLVAVAALPNRYGDDHLAGLGVPPEVRRVLPAIKATATCALVVGTRRSRLRSLTAAAMVAYYAAAVTFHVESRDTLFNTAPAALYGAVAAACV